MSDSIKVAIKVRPLIKREKDENLPTQWTVQGNHIYCTDSEINRRGDYSHVFDHIFDMKTKNTEVYDTVVRPIVDAAVNGFNGTIFAYGQTSSGKTYTMMGSQEEPGVIPLAVENMFDAIANTSGREFLLRVSYLEIYNERVNDLLHEDGTDLKIKEDTKNGLVYVTCKEEVTNCPQNVLSVMKKGDKRRRIGETNMNERSSRSHTIFRITIESRASDSDHTDGAIQVSQLNLVDLAGSERARQTGATGDRFKEGRHINLSLSCLGLVIKQLSEGQEHVNFRDSKLTRILQTSLGGNAMTTIICAVTPAALDETQCTLAFASRAKSIKNKPQLNEVMSDEALLKRYSKQIAKLHAELEKSKRSSQSAKVEEMQTILQEKDRHIQLIEGRMELLQTRIVSGANSVENVDFKNKSRRRRTWCGPSIGGLLNYSLALPTIQETSATEIDPAQSKEAKIKRRRSIIQTPVDDIVNEKFQTAVEDFELELLESEKNWDLGRFSTDSIDSEDYSYVSRRRSGGNHVKFEDNVSVFQISYADSFSGSPEKSEPSTPPQRPEEQDSGTPKEILRERFSHLVDEYNKLQEFTTLEKQIYENKEGIDFKDSDKMEALVNHMQKSVADSETMCLDTNKKYFDLQDKYMELESKYTIALQENDVLKKQVEKLNGMEERLRLIELEKNQLKTDMETKLRRLKKLEEERNDYEFQMELLESKHKTREKELESSLQIAWKDFTDTGDKEKLSNIVHLQSLVDNLTEELEVLKKISEDSKETLKEELLIENKTLVKKIEDYDNLLKNTNNENNKLIEESKELRKLLDQKSNYEDISLKQQNTNVEIFSGENETVESRDTFISTESTREIIQNHLPNCDTTLTSDSQVIFNESETEQIISDDNASKDFKFNVEEKEKHNEKLNEPILNAKGSQTDFTCDRPSLEELEIQINEKLVKISGLEELLRLALENNAEIKSKFESLQVEYEDQKLEIINLEKRVAELLDNEMKISEEYKNVVSKLDEVAIDKDAIADENVKLKLKISENSDQLKNNENHIDSLKTDMDQLKIKLDAKNSEFSNIKTKFEELENIKNRVESQTEESTNVDYVDSAVKILNLEKELEINKNDIEKYKLEITRLNNAILNRSEDISTLNTRNNEQLQTRCDSSSKDSDEQTANLTHLHNGTDGILPAPDVTQNYVQLATENNCAFKVESENATPSKNPEGEDLNLAGLVTETAENCLEKTSTCAEIKTGNENIELLKIELERLTVESKNVLKENILLKSQAETLLGQIENLTINKDLAQRKFEEDLAERNSKLNELQNDIFKLKDQIITMQSEKTLYEGEKCAMQKIINENKTALQRLPKLEAEIQDLELMNEEFEHTISELRTELNTKLLELEAIGVQKYESEIKNLKSYVSNLEEFNKNIQEENDDLKNQLHNQSLNLENDLDDLKLRIAELEKVTNTLEEDKKNLTKRIAELSQTKSEQNATNKPDLLCESQCSDEKLTQEHKECGSIFANASYFDNLDVSIGQDSTIGASAADFSVLEDDKESYNVTIQQMGIQESEITTQASTGEQDQSLSGNETSNKLHELMNIKSLLEDENAKITTELQLKIQESDEIKNDVQGLKLGIEKLQQTIHLLTTENMEMSSKLTIEKERAKEAEAAYQVQVEDLYQRISKVTEEKVKLESDLRIFQEQLGILRASTPVGTEDEVREKIEKYQEKIDLLTTENIELSTNLMDKIEELDKIKESKALLYDHECSYKDQVHQLKNKVDELNNENIELSSNLMEKIEDSDSLKQAYELLENKLAMALKNQLSTSINASENEIMELRAQNSELKSENIDLIAKVTTLSNENAKFSDNLLETMAALDNSRSAQDQNSVFEKSLDNSYHCSRNSDHFFSLEEGSVNDDSVQSLKNKLEAYQLEVTKLTTLNKKLSDLKLSSCSQCTHLRELNDSRRTLKLEVRSLNHKLEDLQKKFEQKCADTEILRNKASEELNLSVMSDALNGSMSENMNVSMVEEKVHSLNNELLTLRQTHEKLSSLYKNKCSEVEKLSESNQAEESIVEAHGTDIPITKDNKVRIERIQVDVDKLREEIRHLKKRNTTHSESLNKFINEKSFLQTEINTLKESKEDLNMKLKNSEMQIEVAKEKVNILENEVTDLNKLVEALRIVEREAKSEKLNFEVEIELLKSEKTNNHQTLEELKTSLKSETENNVILQTKLDNLLKETEELRNRCDILAKTSDKHSNSPTKNEESNAAGENVRCGKTQNSLKMLEEKLAKLSEENILLLEQIEPMQNRSISRDKESPSDIKNELENEIKMAKEYITKEIKSLKPGVELSNLSDKTVEELLVDFLKIIMMKEQEIIKTVQDRFEREKQSLEDAKRQSVDAERRIATWAKELETDIEKLQADLSRQEKENNKSKSEIQRLENDLKESEHEKQLLKEKIDVIENDFNGLQTELAKQSEVDNKQGKEVNAIQERERMAIALARNREIELQNNIKSLKDQHNKKVEELMFALEHQKTKNFELTSNLEGLEANERQLKSIINVKSMDLAKLQQRAVTLETENVQMSEICDQLNKDSRDKNQHIEEITNVLKIKCDKLSEYKTKLESIIPEYDKLKEQVIERKEYGEKYKNEYKGFKEIAEKELNLIKDKLSEEEIKTSSLSEQLTDLNSKNKILQSELQEMKDKYDELEKTNDKLIKKVRNSTSNSRVEAQLEDLKDQNAMLRKNAEGASNRIIELQENKNLAMKDLVSLRGKYEMLIEEKKELEKMVEVHKNQSSSSNSQLTILNDKLEAQIQEKNRIALELEATKLSVSRREKDFVIAQQEIASLKQENKELNEEMEELAKEVQDRIIAAEKLRNELYEMKNNSVKVSNDPEDKFKAPKLENEKINDMIEVQILIEKNKELNKNLETMNKTIDFLRKDNSELKIKITELETKVESRSRGSSRSSSPLLENNRRKQRRSDLYNQSRPLETNNSSSNSPKDCRCAALVQQVRDLELDIVTKNGQIAKLEFQVQSENFPYQKKCKDLQDNLWAFKNKNLALKEEIKRLERAISSTSISECEICRRRQTNRRDQSTQCLPEQKIWLSGTSSGIVDEFAKITKLEKEKALMRDLCRSRTRQIKELQEQLSKCEILLAEKSKSMENSTVPIEDISPMMKLSNDNIRSSTLREKTQQQIIGDNNKRAMKENLSSNILDSASSRVSTNRSNRSLWNHYQ